MASKSVEELALGQEVFIELRRQFNEITEYIGAAQAAILGVGKQTMQCVTEFVQNVSTS